MMIRPVTQAEAEPAERLTALLEAQGWRVLCFDPSVPDWDWDGVDFLIIGDELSAMTLEASRWMERLYADLPSASYH
jgi:hypothetical protein